MSAIHSYFPNVSVAIVGGGIAGTILAAKLAEAGVEDVFAFEKSAQLGAGQSGHSSGVIHSCIYYEPGSRKARDCLDGNRRMYTFCRENGIAHRKVHKLVIATQPKQETALEFLYRRAQENNVQGVHVVSHRTIKKLEPNVVAVTGAIAGLYVPSTGIVDAAGYLAAWTRRAERAGAHILRKNEILNIEPTQHGEGFLITVQNANGDAETCMSRVLVNAAGIDAGKIARMVNPDTPYQTRVNLGGYCSFDKSARSELWTSGMCIYPTPQFYENGTLKTLGIHTTATLESNGNGTRLGKTVLVGPTAVVDLEERLRGEGREFTTPAAFEKMLLEDARAKGISLHAQLERYLPVADFYDALAPIFPKIKKEDLVPDQRGYQVRILKNGAPYNDFVNEPDAKHPSFINWIMPSPGLTSAEPEAEEAMRYVKQALR